MPHMQRLLPLGIVWVIAACSGYPSDREILAKAAENYESCLKTMPSPTMAKRIQTCEELRQGEIKIFRQGAIDIEEARAEGKRLDRERQRREQAEFDNSSTGRALNSLNRAMETSLERQVARSPTPPAAQRGLNCGASEPMFVYREQRSEWEARCGRVSIQRGELPSSGIASPTSQRNGPATVQIGARSITTSTPPGTGDPKDQIAWVNNADVRHCGVSTSDTRSPGENLQWFTMKNVCTVPIKVYISANADTSRFGSLMELQPKTSDRSWWLLTTRPTMEFVVCPTVGPQGQDIHLHEPSKTCYFRR